MTRRVLRVTGATPGAGLLVQPGDAGKALGAGKPAPPSAVSCLGAQLSAFLQGGNYTSREDPPEEVKASWELSAPFLTSLGIGVCGSLPFGETLLRDSRVSVGSTKGDVLGNEDPRSQPHRRCWTSEPRATQAPCRAQASASLEGFSVLGCAAQGCPVPQARLGSGPQAVHVAKHLPLCTELPELAEGKTEVCDLRGRRGDLAGDLQLSPVRHLTGSLSPPSLLSES